MLNVNTNVWKQNVFLNSKLIMNILTYHKLEFLNFLVVVVHRLDELSTPFLLKTVPIYREIKIVMNGKRKISVIPT